MCCVGSPSWNGTYDYYDKLTEIVSWHPPRMLLAQGGEVLVQKKTMDWLENVKKKYPDMLIGLVTNGNVGLNVIEKVEQLFNYIWISFVGFQAETYRKIMGLELPITVKFAEEIVRR
jgi:pyruvate-formate lyase-activating enzyme